MKATKTTTNMRGVGIGLLSSSSRFLFSVAVATALTACGGGSGTVADTEPVVDTTRPDTQPEVKGYTDLEISQGVLSSVNIGNCLVNSPSQRVGIVFPQVDLKGVKGDAPFSVLYTLDGQDITAQVLARATIYVPPAGNAHQFHVVISEQSPDHQSATIGDHFYISVKPQPVAQPAIPAQKPVIEKPAQKPAKKPVEKPAIKPPVKPQEKPVVKPPVKPPEKPATKPPVDPIVKPPVYGNQPPVLNSHIRKDVPFAGYLTVNLLESANDPEGYDLSVSEVRVVSGDILVSNNNDGTIYIEANGAGAYEIVYTLVDIEGAKATGKLTGVVAAEMPSGINLQIDASSVQIADATYPHGTTPTVTIPKLKVNAADGGATVTYTLNGTTVAAGATVSVKAGANVLEVSAVELGGDNQSKKVKVEFTRTEAVAPDNSAD